MRLSLIALSLTLLLSYSLFAQEEDRVLTLGEVFGVTDSAILELAASEMLLGQMGEVMAIMIRRSMVSSLLEQGIINAATADIAMSAATRLPLLNAGVISSEALAEAGIPLIRLGQLNALNSTMIAVVSRFLGIVGAGWLGVDAGMAINKWHYNRYGETLSERIARRLCEVSDCQKLEENGIERTTVRGFHLEEN